jgi:3'(2'), 5'-bisphosphate nucleotidase
LGVTSEADRNADVELAERLTGIIAKAAAAIRAVDHRGVAARQKSDGSHVTAADEAAERIILRELRDLVGEFPIVSEESARVRPEIPTFFLVDPLDGTAEFLAGRDEYTVNIALVRDAIPVIGLIAQPETGTIWRGVVGRGAERLAAMAGPAAFGKATPVASSRWPADRAVVAAVSRSHFEAATATFLRRLPRHDTVACGSALKFARIADGTADIYPRLAPTCEWDVAAGHALVAAAGGLVTTPEGTPLTYGRTDDFRVGGFIAWGDPAAAGQVLATE